jgi:D-inositol-3-phosphate glycosyltransferase
VGGPHNHNQATRQGLTSVLIVSAYAHPHIGGVEVVVGQQARTLAALGHKVTVVTSRCGANGAAHEEVDGYTVVRIRAWNLLEECSGIPFPVWAPSAVWRLSNLIRKADVVHIHDVFYGSSVLAASLARRHHRPIFITQHVGVVEHDKAVVKLAQKLLYSSAGKLAWGWAETITVYNTIVEKFLRDHGVPAGKIRLTYNGINTGYFHPGTPEDKRLTRQRYGLPPNVPIVLSVGRLVPKKGFQKIVDARSPEYEVVHVGPGAIPHHVPDGVRFLGPLNRTDLRDLYQASDIFAFAGVGEMLTLVIQEAMACGLPIVATAEDAYSRYGLDPSGISLVDPEPEVLRSAFLQILGDPARMRYMRSYSRWLAEECFNWWKNSRLHASQYEDVCGHGQPNWRQRLPHHAEISSAFVAAADLGMTDRADDEGRTILR